MPPVLGRLNDTGLEGMMEAIMEELEEMMEMKGEIMEGN